MIRRSEPSLYGSYKPCTIGTLIPAATVSITGKRECGTYNEALEAKPDDLHRKCHSLSRRSSGRLSGVTDCSDLPHSVAFRTWDVTLFLESETVAVLKKDAHFSSVLGRTTGPQATSSTDHLPAGLSDPVPCILNPNDTQNKNLSVKIYDCQNANSVDLVICLGGDGTFLKIGSMFQQAVPPVLAFRLGTLGFLTPFPFGSFQSCIRRAMEGPSTCLLRTRLRCEISRGDQNGKSVTDDSDTSSSRSNSPDKEYHFLNELVVDRGLSPCPCNLLVKVNGKPVTHFEGDGLIVSTPTGSTAYSMATGASLLHPCVPAFLLTPINSLTLSSRAIVLPMTVRLEICINSTARCKLAHFSFDGRSRASNLIRDGDSISVTGSPYPIPCLSTEDQAADWFCGLNSLLNWNARRRQSLHWSGSLCADEDT
ncbi:NAD+ kinase [Clonorchis sinensis]|uniref:NAD(+) kinase n=3 Tax=Clonorchis sinensis TaxID=79923 RepID=G7Y8S4_CLOSI|nr:NAD+ kinase [Clonorchis sinensis]